MKHLQGLPDRTASAAVYALIGCEPVESVIDRNLLSMFLNIARLPASVEYGILQRQLTLVDVENNSFAPAVRKTLQI